MQKHSIKIKYFSIPNCHHIPEVYTRAIPTPFINIHLLSANKLRQNHYLKQTRAVLNTHTTNIYAQHDTSVEIGVEKCMDTEHRAAIPSNA